VGLAGGVQNLLLGRLLLFGAGLVGFGCAAAEPPPGAGNLAARSSRYCLRVLSQYIFKFKYQKSNIKMTMQN
jgi:hypothetical protein